VDREEQEVKPMRTKPTLVIAGIGVLIILTRTPALAHHAFGAEFDATKPVKFQATVTKMLWVNPHSWIYVTVKKPDGTVEEWMIEAGTPNTLLRRGLTKKSLEPGTEVMVDGYQSKDGSLRANGRNLTLPNGETLLIGSSGTGAPGDDTSKK
jgi:uncharacterized protein DUF6152